MSVAMSPNTFRRLAVTSAEMYHQYLTDKVNSGMMDTCSKVISVSRIAPGQVPNELILFVGEPVLYSDRCQILVYEKPVESLSIVSVQKIAPSFFRVRITDHGDFLLSQPQLSPSDIHIYSDFRFLIKRLREFYENAPLCFQPPAPSCRETLPPEHTDGLSREQLSAIDLIFRSPISYISGAPGTGKTKAVLSRCILRYMLSKQRVFLLAPTNNAVEQMLRGVLPILKDAGFDLRLVYRIGASSGEFAAEYPEVIADTALENALNELLNQKALYTARLSEAEQLEQTAELLRSRLDSAKALHTQRLALLPELNRIHPLLHEAADQLDKVSPAFNAIQEQYNLLDDRWKSLCSAIRSCELEIAGTEARIERLRHGFFKKKARQAAEEQLTSLRSSLTELLSSQGSIIVSLEKVGRNMADSQEQYQQCRGRYEELSRQSAVLLRKLTILSDQCAALGFPAESSATNIPFSTDEADAFIDSLECEYQKAKSEADTHPVSEYQRALDDVTNRLNSLGSNTKLEQKKKALVLAATIDSALSELSPGQQEDDEEAISHVFLDEAGYTSLIKAMTAFVCQAPITFLGDHKQLPPVCEMNRIDKECAPICLWALPAAYCSELMNNGFLELYHNCYCRRWEPTFSAIAYHSLNTSYRFGQTLATILGKYIYTPAFRGVSGAPFEILVIDAPGGRNPTKRTSGSEADAIRDFLQHNALEDVAILAPYRNQIKLLRRTLPRDYRENILTVHRSQGCEWDTVIFSVTDIYNPYYVDSNHPVGRSVLNTAISRAKKRLIIVCDVAVWKPRGMQMISELIRCGQLISAFDTIDLPSEDSALEETTATERMIL